MDNWNSSMSWFRIALLLSLGILTTGCSGKGFKEAEEVSGVVTLNGQPLPKATVIFQPIGSANPGPSSSGSTGDNGDFMLEFAGYKKGAVVGKHRVLVTTQRFAPRSGNPDAEEEIAPDLIPDRYKTEPVTVEVPAGGTKTIKIELEGPPPRAPGTAPSPEDRRG
jgi:hypothetical protein